MGLFNMGPLGNALPPLQQQAGNQNQFPQAGHNNGQQAGNQNLLPLQGPFEPANANPPVLQGAPPQPPGVGQNLNVVAGGVDHP